MEILRLDACWDPFLMLEWKKVDQEFIDIYEWEAHTQARKWVNWTLEFTSNHFWITSNSSLRSSRRLINLQSEKTQKINNRILNWEINNKDQEILRRYFVNREQPKWIATNLKLEKIYLLFSWEN